MMGNGEIAWSCPDCGSANIDPVDDPDYDGSELLSVCGDCGRSGEDEEFALVTLKKDTADA